MQPYGNREFKAATCPLCKRRVKARGSSYMFSRMKIQLRKHRSTEGDPTSSWCEIGDEYVLPED